MKYLDLFSGIGGFALGAYNAGWRFDEHYFSEVDKYAKTVYRQRFPDAVSLGDIREIDAKALADAERSKRGNEYGMFEGSCDKRKEERSSNRVRCGDTTEWFITGGFPCQDISVAGKGEGIGGSRSGLWFEMWRIIRSLRPRVVIIENVGAITIRGLDTLLSSLAGIRYDAEWQDIRAEDMGAPHERKRIWIVAYPEGQRRREEGQYSERSPERPPGGSEIPDTDQQHDDSSRSGAGAVCRERREKAELSGRQSAWWPAEPAVGRVAHGIPKRVDRLKCLGNAIVPQIAELLFRQIKATM